jgi:hypothetical protein
MTAINFTAPIVLTTPNDTFGDIQTTIHYNASAGYYDLIDYRNRGRCLTCLNDLPGFSAVDVRTTLMNTGWWIMDNALGSHALPIKLDNIKVWMQGARPTRGVDWAELGHPTAVRRCVAYLDSLT